MKRITAVLLSAALLLCSCNNNNEVKIKDENIMDAFSQMSDEPILAAYPVSINGVQINKSPEKAVCLCESLFDIINEMGYGDRVAGVGSYISASSLTDVGKPTQPDIEKIISIKPDVLFTSTAIPNKDVITLSDNGIETVYIPNPHSADEFGRIYSAIGMIFEGMFDGESKGSEAFSEIEHSLTSADNKNCGSFIYITEGLAAAGGNTFENSVLSIFGTSVAEKNGIIGYSTDYEKLSGISPDYVFLNSRYDIEALRKDEFYGQLDAVVNGRVILVDNSYFENPSKKITELIKNINQQIS